MFYKKLPLFIKNCPLLFIKNSMLLIVIYKKLNFWEEYTPLLQAPSNLAGSKIENTLFFPLFKSFSEIKYWKKHPPCKLYFILKGRPSNQLLQNLSRNTCFCRLQANLKIGWQAPGRILEPGSQVWYAVLQNRYFVGNFPDSLVKTISSFNSLVLAIDGWSSFLLYLLWHLLMCANDACNKINEICTSQAQ